MYTTGQYSTLGHVENINSSLKHFVTRESGCQTDDVKIVPPSMRRIRSQRGHAIATQMSNISLSSSGSISNTSDSNGAICTRQLNASDQGFHSLPRQGARICLQKLEANCSGSPYLMASGSTSSLPYQVTMQHANPDSQHMSKLRKNTSVSSRSDEFYGFQIGCHNATSGNMVSNYNSSTSSLNSSSVLQNARNLSSVHSSQSFDTEETPIHPMSTSPSDHPFSSSVTSCSVNSSCCQSPAHMATETESQYSTLDGRNCSPSGVCEDSDMSESSIHSCSIPTTDHWTYKHAPMDERTSSCSSPISNVCNSLEHSPKKTDTISLSSADSERCNTSMHLAPDCKSYSHGYINKAGKLRHDLYECREHHSHDDRVSLHSNHSLTRSISLRKAKKPPLPPKRTDSLQRKPQRKPYHNEKLLNEQLISSLQESLKSHSASFCGQMPLSGLEDPWGMGPRSQSSLSVASSGKSAPAAVCPTTPILSDSSSQHSEFTKSLHMDFPHSCSEHGPSSQIMGPVLTKENSRCSDSNGHPLSAYIKTGINSMMAASPDKVQLMTSPSSGYSSESITPTAGTPVTSLLRAKSPAGRPKPKVPERKSSLRSSVSSYSTPLSSNMLDNVKILPTPPPPPKTLPGLVTLQSSPDSSMRGFATANISPIIPVLLAVSANSEEKQRSSPVSSTIPEECKTSISFSSDSSPFTSKVSSPLMLIEDKMSALPLPPPPPLPLVHTQPLTPPSPGKDFQAVTILKAADFPMSLDTIENIKEQSSRQSDKCVRHERPVITAQALQRVQLRPIKLMKLENIFTDIITTVCGPESPESNKKRRISTDKPVQTEIVKILITPDSASQLQNGMDTTDFPSKESTHKMASNPDSVLLEPVTNTYTNENILQLSPDTGLLRSTTSHSNGLYSTATLCTSNDTLQNQRSPISSKHNHALILPPILHQPVLNDLKHLEVTGAAMFLEPETLKSRSLTDIVNQQEIPLQLEFEAESDSQNSTPGSPRRHSLSSEISSDSLPDPQLTGLTVSDQDMGLCDTDLGLSDKDFVLSDDKGITDDSLSSSSGSIIFKEEENDENGEFLKWVNVKFYYVSLI